MSRRRALVGLDESRAGSYQSEHLAGPVRGLKGPPFVANGAHRPLSAQEEVV